MRAAWIESYNRFIGATPITMHTNSSIATAQTIEVFREITCELSRLGAKYALLHPGISSEPDFTSDIDIVLDEPPPKILEPILQSLANKDRLQIVQRLHYDVPHGYYYVLRIPEHGGYAYLQLDCLHDPYGINRYHLNSTHLLEDRAPFGNYYRIATDKEAEYLTIKRSLKRNATPANTRELVELINSSSPALSDRLQHWFGEKRANQLLIHCRNNNFNLAAQLILSSGSHIEKLFNWQHPARSAARATWSFARNIARFFQPTGFFVVLIGPDGCGKTTVSEGLRQHMQRAFRSTWRFHWRPNLLPKLGKSRNSDQSQAAAHESLPPTGKSKYSGIVSLIRFIYYWVDFLIGYWLVIYPRKVRSTLIVGERYFPDILVHPERYGFSVPKWFVRAAGTLVPKPDLLIFLTGDPEAIHNRKPELPVDIIASQLKEYVSEITHWGNHIPINTCQPIDKVFAQLEGRISHMLQDRISPTACPDAVKYAFPRYGRTRVLIDRNTAKGALQRLYHPQNKIARLMVNAIDLAPRIALPLFTKRIRGTYYGNFPFLEADKTIYERFSDNNLSISYYMGNGGPRSKITAQANARNNASVYVKIAETAAAQALLRNEHNTLERNLSEAGSAPCAIDLKLSDDWLYLFITGPSPDYHQSNLILTNSHEQYAAGIALKSLHESTFSEFEQKLCLEQRISHVTESPYYGAEGHICSQSLRLLHEHFASDLIKTHRNHGDFAPWNILIDDKKKLFVFDWEYSEEPASAFSDLFHFLRSTRHFAMHMSPSRTIADILDPNAKHAGILSAHAEHLNVAIGDLPYYLLIYLIRELLRHAETESPIHTHAHDPMQASQITYLGDCINAVYVTIKQGNRPRRILVSAYACEPDKGSEPGVGWNWAELIATNNLTWVVTRSNNRESIENALSHTPNSNLKFIYVDLPAWARFWKIKQRGVRTYYYMWQLWALSASRKAHRKEQFDLAHHVTFVNDWLWSFLAFMPIPFIWGPIGSHPPAPFGLLPHFRAKVTEFIRIAIQRTMRMIDPLYWITAIRATKIIAINKEICRQFPLNIIGRGKCVIEPAIAYEDSGLSREIAGSGVFSILYVGRFHYTKCPHLAIQAFARSTKGAPESRLTMIGRGPEENNLRALARNLGCSEQIVFIPWLAQSEVFLAMNTSDIFLFPSTEGGGMVVIEAMANGLPVICLDYGGPGQMVCTQCGSKAPVASKEEAIHALHDSLTHFHADKKALIAASNAATHYARETLSWSEKCHRVNSIYDQITTAE